MLFIKFYYFYAIPSTCSSICYFNLACLILLILFLQLHEIAVVMWEWCANKCETTDINIVAKIVLPKNDGAYIQIMHSNNVYLNLTSNSCNIANCLSKGQLIRHNFSLRLSIILVYPMVWARWNSCLWFAGICRKTSFTFSSVKHIHQNEDGMFEI